MMWRRQFFYYAFVTMSILVSTSSCSTVVAGNLSDIFPLPTGQEMNLISKAPPTNLQSLSLFGPAVSNEVDKAYLAAGGYNDNQKWNEAAQLCPYVAHLAAKEKATLSLLQVERIVSVMALALADGGDMDRAILLYDYRIDVIDDKNDWETKLPPGIRITRQYDEQFGYILRSMAYRDRALLNVVRGDRMVEVLSDLEKAVEYTIPGGNRQDAPQIQLMVFNNMVQTGQFKGAVSAVESRLTQISENQESVIAEVLFSILRMGGIAAVNINDLELAQSYYQQLVTMAESSGYYDDLVPTDKQASMMIEQELELRNR